MMTGISRDMMRSNLNVIHVLSKLFIIVSQQQSAYNSVYMTTTNLQSTSNWELFELSLYTHIQSI